MKIIHYKRHASSFHAHAGASTQCFFVPDKKVLIYAETIGSFGSEKIGLTEKKEILEEARAVQGGTVVVKNNPGYTSPYKFHKKDDESVTYTEIVTLDIDEARIDALIKNIRNRDQVQKAVDEDLKILKESGKPKS